MTRQRVLARGLLLGGALALLGGVPGLLAGQSDSVTVVPGDRYRAGQVRERLLGSDYRSVWTTGARIPLLDLGSFEGGLVPVERGGGEQTRSLRLRDATGREYNFRSVDKNIPQGLEPELRGTWVEDVLQDQVSSMHPSASIVATALLDAVGVLNPAPRLFVMPDDARLAEFREEFAGMLGTLEAHANEAEDGSWAFAGSREVESDLDFFELLRESPLHRPDARSLLEDRLVSLVMGDWDRHAGQYRWARFDSAGMHRWVPVPEDRDFAFSDYDGLLPGLAGSLLPNVAPFEDRYPANLWGLVENSSPVDERVLSRLSRPDWEAAVSKVTAALTDGVIEDAVRRMPSEQFRESGPELIRTLRARRDGLEEVARRYYLLLASRAEVHATDAAERADVERLPGGAVRVTLAAADSAVPGPSFDRTFHPEETREIRVHLHGGDDVATVRGAATGGLLVRVIGGAGDDTLVDRGAVDPRAVLTSFHDEEGESSIDAGPGTVVDGSDFEEPVWIPGEVRPPRDSGARRSWFVPWLGHEGTEGVIVGGGPSWTWHGFRRFPHAGHVTVRGMYGLGSGRAALDATADFPGVGSAPDLRVHARVSAMEAYRFHGLGNASPSGDAIEGEVIRFGQRRFAVSLGYRPLPGVDLALGPVIEQLEPDPPPAALPRIPGPAGEYGKVGLAGRLAIETAPGRRALDPGFRLETSGDLYPAAWDLAAPFGRLRADAAGYAPLPGGALLAVRAGGTQLWGDAPLLEAPSLGGSETLRGFEYQRFTGDAMLHAGLEARAFLRPARLVLNGDLGALVFTDAGRVFADGRSEGGWHAAVGAGLWFETMGRSLSLSYARGEAHRLYLKLGMPF